MGSHLDKPVKEKETDNSTLHGKLSFSGSAMQGWRNNMEDSHYGGTFKVDGADVSLAAVFDGHGGDLVAKEA
jgi:serine/threonine protein phosphatase PrpC